jgi:D-glycero-D-manno-heptose 1,7-bisphosphate phosphatase
MQKAVFLDRDGVLNQEVGDYIKKLEDFKLLPFIFNGLKQLADAGFLLIVVTNQGGIAKGMYAKETLNIMHNFLESELLKHQIRLTEIFYCPHHPDFGNCLCRKPNSILVEKAVSKYKIDPSKSYFIGDKQRDIDCGNAVGVKGILIDSNQDWTVFIDSMINNTLTNA